MSVTIDDYKNTIQNEFLFSECYDTDESLVRSFNIGTILLMPHPKHKQRPWLRKAFDEWNRGGRRVLLITPFRTSCKYFQEYLTKNAEIRVITTSLKYGEHIVLRPMILAIFKAKPLRELNHLVTFD
jgi:hypothetical protein